MAVPLHEAGQRYIVQPIDLPAPERLAYLERSIESLGLPLGTYDDAAHESFMQAPSSMRERAERNAAMMRLLVSLGQRVGWPERLCLVERKFGPDCPSKATLKRHLKAIRGVDPINYAPALLPGYKGKVATAEISDMAWQFFLTTIRDAAPEFPLIQAWRDARDVGRKMGWAWPSYPTAYRRWTGLSEAQRLEARHGRADAARWLTQPAQRDKTTIGPLEWVSLDGRMLDFWVDWGDGRPVRPIMLALVDVASNMVLDYGLAPSENAADTVRVIKRICQTFGIPDRIYTDNGSSFAGHMVAGGNVHRFRNGGKKPEGIQPPGICKQMGIKLHFALPGNGQAKIAERTFATLSRVIDDRPEFEGAHAGHAPGASPGAKVRPVPVQTAMDVLKREVLRHNREPGRRAQGAQGRSYEQVFSAGLAIRVMRKPTARQLYLSGLIYSPVAVDRFGMMKKHGWVYGSPLTQDVLLRFHGKGQRILLGRDPDDFNAPAIAFDEAGQLICEGIEPVQAGAYGSGDGIRTAARNGKAARAAVAAGIEANNYLDDEQFKALLAQLEAPDGEKFDTPEQVVAPRFAAPLRPKRGSATPSEEPAIPEEFYRNMDTALAASRSRGGKSA